MTSERTPLLSTDENGETSSLSELPQASKCQRLKRFLTSNHFLLYVCCFITSWGDRMWMFAIGVYMIALYPSSLSLTAIYGFVNCGASLLFGSVIGDMIDRTQRLKAVRVALLFRNLSIFGCSASVFLTFTFWDDVKDSVWLEVSKGGIIFLAVVAHLASMANTITVTKDWVVVICGSDKQSLMEMSAFFRRIDLVCKIVSPIVVGQIMSFASNLASAVFICCENIVTLIVMYALLRIIYRRVPRLATKEDPSKNGTSEASKEEFAEHSKKKARLWFSRLCFTCISFGKGWSCYIRQPVAAAGVSLAMMFMTVLGFDNITVGYAYSQGMSPSVLSGAMAGAAVTGIIGTMLFQPLRKRFGLVVTGNIAYIIDLLLLVICLWSVFAPGTGFLKWPDANVTAPLTTDIAIPLTANLSTAAPSPNATSDPSAQGPGLNVSLLLLLTGIVLSRIGLWLVDLVVTQLILETVSERERGKVNGVQFSLNMFLDLLKFLLVILVPQPAYFGFLVMASFAFIVLGFLIFLVYSCCRRCTDPATEEEGTSSERNALIEDRSDKTQSEV